MAGTTNPSAPTRRTPQACTTCRRRKTKCDGSRPRCRYCKAKGVLCSWPYPTPSIDGPDEFVATSPSAPAPGAVYAAATPASSNIVVATSPELPARRALDRCFSLFYERHLCSDFCSFLYRPGFEENYSQHQFLVLAIVALCARYLTPQEAQRDFGLASGEDILARYVPMARAMARQSSDQPSVSNTQGHLVLALAELLSNSGSRHWMYAGTAIRMGQAMRLNKEYHQRHGLRERECRRRTFWACMQLDQLLAFLLSKPRTIPAMSFGIALPSTDASLAYREETQGVVEMLEARIRDGTSRPSDLGLAPFWLRTARLWSDMAELDIFHRRLRDGLPPTDPRSEFARRTAAVNQWATALPEGLLWSAENLASFEGLGHGQGPTFVAMHLLLRSALCVAHQCYLPQLDGSSILLDAVDAAGWSLLHREATLVATCVANALAVGDMLSLLLAQGHHHHNRHLLQSVWVAMAVLAAANPLLWVQYARDPEYADSDTVRHAEQSFDAICSTVEAWTDTWSAARQWLASLRMMRLTYRAAYFGLVPDEPTASPETGESGMNADDGEDRRQDDDDAAADDESDYRPGPGDGFLIDFGVPHLCASIRMIATDPMAKHETLHSVWASLAGGWSYSGLVEQSTDAGVLGQVEPPAMDLGHQLWQ
ncbi:fungal-specific transcription factor domain-containing protein [Microdochium trichocladiopsis]|uniref:Fungal-specific transcription factor domain-containing protein n=1 Tax=Microdochium trichocladiopsis TaxID=1682393 RepID=A0A9P8XUH7_9PEZI|nr:fungal-specific transcription factor domain-containing protein [Microdochium trichocladiopsis]KAH7014554.1 fungal-specific transcription factor domain-containing protein [Microdochium trichocladiopsis]